MLGPVKGEYSILLNAFLFALAPVLPILIIGFTRQSLLALLTRPVFSLRKFELNELNRAAVIYESVCGRLKQQFLQFGWPVLSVSCGFSPIVLH
jgi:hypothetical protein